MTIHRDNTLDIWTKTAIQILTRKIREKLSFLLSSRDLNLDRLILNPICHFDSLSLCRIRIFLFCFQIEAGGDETEISDVPALAAYLQLGSMDWKYKTEPQPGKHPLTILVIDFKTPINIIEINQIFGAGSKCLIRRAEVSKEFQIYFC